MSSQNKINSQSTAFDIPVVLFMFKREDKTPQIIKQLSKIRPTTLYLIADGGRNQAEHETAIRTRKAVEEAIDWECDIRKNYANENRGVYKNIGEGAKWVLSQEKWAIFLEDDNFPQVSFFNYCREMLIRYALEERILWVCGTNYLGRYKSKYSYMFNQNLLPCGWASWSDKFLRYYDGELSTFAPEVDYKVLRKHYHNKALAKQEFNNFCVEKKRALRGERFVSWDYQMAYTIRKYNLLGISPCNNQIKNIGVDSDSIHGGSSYSSIMTQRFCGMDSYPLEFPLIHPPQIKVDKKYSRKISNIILIPFRIRFKLGFFKILRRVLRVKENEHLKDKLNILSFIKK